MSLSPHSPGLAHPADAGYRNGAMTKHPRDGAMSLCLLLLLAGFILCTALDLNGSSTPFWSGILHDPSSADSVLLFRPRQVRSDEWLVWTPSILAQANHRPAWPVENPALGAGKSPLIMSLPARHYSMFFRPQLYGFFLFGTERGFSWYWNTKIFGLLAAMFLLLWRLSGGRRWLAVCGALLVFSAGYIQWFFSCPPMLPEMLSMWALALVCIMTLTGHCTLLMRIAATAGLVAGIVNFALCCYPPYQIPLVYLGAAILWGWSWQRRDADPVPPAHVVLSFCAAAICICCVLIPFFIECIPTLRMVANTAYPGARRSNGGGISFVNLLRGLAAPLIFEKSYPESMDNVCDASGFFPFALAAIPLLLIRLKGNWPKLKLLLPCCGFLAFFVLFSLLPMPHWLAVATGLGLTTTERWALPIGIANIFLATLLLPGIGAAPLKHRLIAWLFAMAVTAGWIADASRGSPGFFSPWRIAALLAAAALLFASYLTGRAPLFTLCALCILSPAALTVNPVTQGLGALLHSPAAAAVHEIALADPTAGWVAYDSSFLSQFLMAGGVPVLSGAKTVPDLRFYGQLDPAGKSRGIYNRYGIAVFQTPPDPGAMGFKLVNFCGYVVVIQPGNAALRSEGIRYYLFPHPARVPGLDLVKALPDSHIWIYRTVDQP